MGVVWLAREISTGEQVAVKTIAPALSHNARARRRFIREARAGMRLHHPHIIRLMDFKAEGRRTLAMVMEYFPSETLSAFWQRRPDWSQIRAIILQVLDGLALAHSLGVVHRDLKPDNILIGPDPLGEPMAKIVDFGIAQVLEVDTRRSTGRLTGSNLLGTPPYMAPEQLFHAADVGASADIYAVAVILYELLTGRLPFVGGDPNQLLASKLSERQVDFEPLPHLNLPLGVRELVTRNLSAHPLERHLFASDFFGELAALSATPARQVDWIVSPPSQRGEPTREWDVSTRVIPESLSMGAATAGPGSTLMVREPRLVGRQAAQAELLAALSDMQAAQAPHAVLISGPSGAGTSRLVHWFRSVITLEGQALPIVVDAGTNQLSGALRAALLRIIASGRIEHLPGRDWLELGLRALGVDEDKKLAEQLISLVQPSANTVRGGVSSGARAVLLQLRILRQLCGLRPVCLLLEGSRAENCPQLATWTRWMTELRVLEDCPLLIVASTPPSPVIREARAQPAIRVVELEPLDDEHSAELLASMDLEGEPAEMIVREGGGHPLTLVEARWFLRDAAHLHASGVHAEGADLLDLALLARFKRAALPIDRQEDLRTLLGMLACGPPRVRYDDIVSVALEWDGSYSETKVQNLLWLAQAERLIHDVDTAHPALEVKHPIWKDILERRALSSPGADELRRAWARALSRDDADLPALAVRAAHLFALGDLDRALLTRIEAIALAQRDAELTKLRGLIAGLSRDLPLFERSRHYPWVRDRIVLIEAETQLLFANPDAAAAALSVLRARGSQVSPMFRIEAEIWQAEVDLQAGSPKAAGRALLSVQRAVLQGGSKHLRLSFALTRARIARQLGHFQDVAQTLEELQEIALGAGFEELNGSLRIERGLTEGALLRPRVAARHLMVASAVLAQGASRLLRIRAGLWLTYFQTDGTNWSEAAMQLDVLYNVLALIGCKSLEIEARLVLAALDLASGRADAAHEVLKQKGGARMTGVAELCRKVLVVECDLLSKEPSLSPQRYRLDLRELSRADYYRPLVFASLQRQARLWRQLPGPRPPWLEMWDITRGQPRGF